MPRVTLTESRDLASPRKPSDTLRGAAPTEDLGAKIQGHRHSPRGSRRLRYAIPLLFIGLIIAFCIGLYVGYQNLDFTRLRYDPVARNVFFRLRLPRVIMAAIVGSSLASVGAALQSLFRNPLADPFTLGVSGGAALGAGIAIVLGLGVRVAGVPLVFLAAFAGSLLAVFVVYRLAHTGGVVLPGALLLSGVVMNFCASAGVLLLQYLASSSQSLQILRWLMGSLDVVGFDLIWRVLVFLIPSWVLLMAHARDLHLLAIGEESAASLGVNVRRTERIIYVVSSLIVGVTVSIGGTIGFVGLIVPHIARLLFGQDVRVLLPTSFLLGAAFLVLADSLARVVVSPSELPVGVVTALAGGPVFLWLLRNRRRYSAI
jgi:iron complex transport system permease protein